MYNALEWVAAGLGNPEKEYEGTRHNLGFEVIDQLGRNHHIKVTRAKFQAYVGEGVIAGRKVLLVKPQTYVNQSGASIREVLRYYKLTPCRFIVVYDDVNLRPGQVRIREKGSAGGHNGIKSLICHMGSQEFIRVRIGVGQKPEGWNLKDYVLGRFEPDQRGLMARAVAMAAESVETILESGTAFAMNKFNSGMSFLPLQKEDGFYE
ncbi:MAG: aminoacyl-tRNA hydrolase [Clostridiales bacterium]|jgi:PTH1 family peptidyl-tRNA hydrolase|nr:aminoacyl-tRNA hydrolase [Clostridiales bacterium]